ncbi:AraC family transcriptional regulator [Mucilaginibacter limnophilus]|uniref:AraC family transcriptional regulator n=1 Tax=Mucilaginibacter limnophilus TaxID=1932778 RepID=A0A437MU62_9SPHI|nr:helix-turn-helix domain-containing protein [Mucilaginibacter limnophilus]RVU01201.1 AraC family transcriptional regulator [Mucilaginibacter limnophilus]
MEYTEVKPCRELQSFIHAFWELKGAENDGQWERIFPDGCPGLVMNLGERCKTDNGLVTMEFGKTYVVGAMTSFKDSFIDHNTHLLGVCLKPATFSNFYKYAPQSELKDNTIEFDRSYSFNTDRIIKERSNYLNQFFSQRIIDKKNQLHSALEDIQHSNGQLNIFELAKRNHMTLRQLERNFKMQIGITPKEYSKIIRFQKALSLINSASNRTLSEIAYECGFYDHAHLSNEIKEHTGLTPSEL